jgi:hypothetical protein
MVCEEALRGAHDFEHPAHLMSFSTVGDDFVSQIIQPRFVVGLPVEWTDWASSVKYRVIVRCCGNALKQTCMCRATPASFQQVNTSIRL